LDSAFPLFANEGPDGRLDVGDAILVDTIHTCSGFLGLREPYGHVDFYPNKGTMPQPGCGDNDIVGESVCVTLALVQVLRMAQKVNGELLTITHWLGQLFGDILPPFPRLDPRALYSRSLSKVALA